MVDRSHPFRPVVGSDSFKETHNVLLLLPDRVRIVTMPPSEAMRLEQNMRTGDSNGEWGSDPSDIPLPAITELEARTEAGSLDLIFRDEHGQLSKKGFMLGKTKVAEFLEEIPRQAGGQWHVDTRRDSPLATVIGYMICALIVAVLTALFYFGIESGWITRGPALLVTIVNFFGLTGLLVVGGILMLLCLVAVAKTILRPGNVLRLTRAP
jgi:hypothetical protein